MMKLDEHRVTSEQDYGPWLDVATLYAHGNLFFLKVEGGYSRPYEEEWYELSAPPAKPLSELLTGETWAGTGDCSVLLADDLGVSVTPTSDPS